MSGGILKTLNNYFAHQQLNLFVFLLAFLLTGPVMAITQTKDENSKKNEKKNLLSSSVDGISSRKKKKLVIDFRKKNQKSSNNSELNDKINEAESDLRGVENSNLVTNTSNIDHSEKSSKAGQLTMVTRPPVVKAVVNEKPSQFGISLTIVKSQEVELPKNGQYSKETTFIFIPNYNITDIYSAGLKFIGVHDANDTKKSDMKSGSAYITKKAEDLNLYLTASPTLVYAFPVNSSQRNIDSFLGAVQGKLNFATKKDIIGDFAFNTTLGLTKSFYEYSTQLNLDPESDDVYNSDYSTFEAIGLDHPIIGDLSISFTLSNKQAWDFSGEQKNSYDVTETINWSISKNFTLFGGLENEEAAKVYESDLKYRFYNADTSTFVIGTSIGI
jgi:hypothetical protein